MDWKYYSVLPGIKYAESPTGNLRFKPPTPHIPEEGTIDVSEISTVHCPQSGKSGGDGQEDCLMLNVYVPEYAFNDPQIKLPVMVWIYGGGFTRLVCCSANFYSKVKLIKIKL